MNETFWWWFCTIIFSAVSVYIGGFMLCCIGLLLEYMERTLIKGEIMSLITLKKEVCVHDILNYPIDISRSTHSLGAILEELEREKRIQVVYPAPPMHWGLPYHP